MSFSCSCTGSAPTLCYGCPLLRYTQLMFTQVCFPHKFALRRRQAGKNQHRKSYVIGRTPLVSFGVLDQLLLHPTCACSYSTPSLNYRVDATLRRRRLRVSPVCSSGLDRPRTCTSLCVLLPLCRTPFTSGSSSLSPCGLVVTFCFRVSSLGFVTVAVARLDVREFYDLYWISTTNLVCADP